MVTNPDEIVSMVVCKDVLYLATRSTVYAKDGNGIWQEIPLPKNEAEYMRAKEAIPYQRLDVAAFPAGTINYA